jgi:hypothetical protein
VKKEAFFSLSLSLTYYGLPPVLLCVDLLPKKKEKKKCSFSEYTQNRIIVKKKPRLNDRDENPKPLDKNRDTIPRLEEQSSRPGQ